MKWLIFIITCIVFSCTSKKPHRVNEILPELTSKINQNQYSSMVIDIVNDTLKVDLNYFAITDQVRTVYDMENIADPEGSFTIPENGKYWYIPFDSNYYPHQIPAGESGSILCLCGDISKGCFRTKQVNAYKCVPKADNPCDDCNAGIDIAITGIAGVIIKGDIVKFNNKIYQ